MPRYFKNKLEDYVQGESTIDTNASKWHEQIQSLVKIITDSLSNMTSDGGLYVGTAGVAYMLYYISNYGPFFNNKIAYLQLAKSILERDMDFCRKQNCSKPDEVSFILGPTGLYTIGALLGQSLQNEAMVAENTEKFRAAAKECMKQNFLSCGSDELFVGRAGYICGALTMQKKLGIKVVDDETLSNICVTMVQSGRDYSKRHRSRSPLMYAYYNTEYLGAAHGLSSILQMILSVPSFLDAYPHAARDVKKSVDWLLSLQQPNGNFAPAMDEVKSPRPEIDELVHWCHGAPGIVYLFAKAYNVWGDEKYLQACIRCGEITWQKGLLYKGPGICHGVAGSGYVFLLLYRLTKDEKHLHRAWQFANFIFTQKFQSEAKAPDNPFSLYEGLAGTVCFLLDLMQPEKAEFPFFDVF